VAAGHSGEQDSLYSTTASCLLNMCAFALWVGPLLSQVTKGLYSGKDSVRESTLDALEALPEFVNSDCPRDALLGRSLWLACHDVEAETASKAEELWDIYGHPISVEDDIPLLTELLQDEGADIRISAANAIADALSGDSRSVDVNSFRSFLSFMSELFPRSPRRNL